MEYSEKIKSCIQSYLDKDEWHYTFDKDQGVFNAKIKLDGRLNRCDITVRIRDDYYTVYGGIAINADTKSIPAVAEYLHRANFGLKIGSFELDHNDGEIRYKVCVDCGDNCDCMPSESVILRSLELAAVMFDTYGEGLMGVMFKNVSPEEAIKTAEEENT